MQFLSTIPIKGLVRIAEDAVTDLETAVGENDVDQVRGQYTKITVARDRTVQLGAEAQQCIGQTDFTSGDTSVQVGAPDGIDDPGPVDVPPPPTVLAPPNASPMM